MMAFQKSRLPNAKRSDPVIKANFLPKIGILKMCNVAYVKTDINNKMIVLNRCHEITDRI